MRGPLLIRLECGSRPLGKRGRRGVQGYAGGSVAGLLWGGWVFADQLIGRAFQTWINARLVHVQHAQALADTSRCAFIYSVSLDLEAVGVLVQLLFGAKNQECATLRADPRIIEFR